MSLAFSDTTNKNGIIQRIERELGFSYGDISGDSTKLAEFTADVNETHDHALGIVFEVGGTWQFDDTNYTDYPIITTNLVSGQSDYSFTADEDGNLILEIYKVFVKDSSGIYHEIFPVDVEQEGANSNFTSGQNIGGQPYCYDKMSNALFLDPIPNYNSTNGLKVYVSREGSYFTVSDTTKKPGIAGIFHDYYFYRPALKYAIRKTLPNAANLSTEVTRIETAMADYYKSREKDVQKTLRAIVRSSR